MTSSVQEEKFPAVGECIYCGSKNDLHDEHIVPLSFGGLHVLRQASCNLCGQKTSADEGYCCEHMFKALRVHHQIRTRRPKKRATHLTILAGETPHGAPKQNIPVGEAPGAVILPVLGPPEICFGPTRRNKCEMLGFYISETTSDAKQRSIKLKEGGLSGALIYNEFKIDPFARVLAKISHGYAVSQVGIGGFRPLLQKLILAEESSFSFFVGSTAIVGDGVPEPTGTQIGGYQIVPRSFAIRGVNYLLVQIRLFSHLRPASPVYSIIAGELLS